MKGSGAEAFRFITSTTSTSGCAGGEPGTAVCFLMRLGQRSCAIARKDRTAEDGLPLANEMRNTGTKIHGLQVIEEESIRSERVRDDGQPRTSGIAPGGIVRIGPIRNLDALGRSHTPRSLSSNSLDARPTGDACAGPCASAVSSGQTIHMPARRFKNTCGKFKLVLAQEKWRGYSDR